MADKLIEYSKIVSMLLKELNKVRDNPAYLLGTLRERLKSYEDDSKLYYPIKGANLTYQTIQGKQPVLELIEELISKAPCPKLSWSFELHKAADKRARALGDTSGYSQKIIALETDELVLNYTDFKGYISEQVMYGFIDPKELLCELLIDDGYPNRQHRKQFFNHKPNHVGIGIHDHDKYKFVAVFIYAEHVSSKRAAIHLPNQEQQCKCCII